MADKFDSLVQYCHLCFIFFPVWLLFIFFNKLHIMVFTPGLLLLLFTLKGINKMPLSWIV